MAKRRQTGRRPNAPHPFDKVDVTKIGGYSSWMPWEQRVPNGELTTLWDQTGDLHATRVRELDGDAIRDVISRRPVRFVRARLGPLRWTEAEECYRFWKKEVKPHLCQDDLPGHETPAGYCYVASEWHLASGEVVILLEVDH
jgi:hypothetical protein